MINGVENSSIGEEAIQDYLDYIEDKNFSSFA